MTIAKTAKSLMFCKNFNNHLPQNETFYFSLFLIVSVDVL